MNQDLSQYVGKRVVFKQPSDSLVEVLVLEATEMALYGLPTNMGPGCQEWSMVRVPICGQAARFDIVSVRDGSAMVLRMKEQLRGELTNQYLNHTLDAETIHKASVLELFIKLVGKDKTPDKPEFSDLFGDDLSSGDLRLDFGDGHYEREKQTVCIHIPCVLDTEQLANGVYIFLQQKPKED